MKTNTDTTAAKNGDSSPQDGFEVAGTMHRLQVEGGCWQFIAENGTKYEVMGELANQLYADGLKATVRLKLRPGMNSICMVGTIAEVIEVISVTKP